MATPQKKPRLSPTCQTLTTLPPVLQRRVLAYVANEDCLERIDFQGFKVNVKELQPLALVSKAWYVLATEAMSERVLEVLYVPCKGHDMRRSEMLVLRNQFILRRVHTQRVVVELPLDYGTPKTQVFAEVLSHAPDLHSLEIETAGRSDFEGAPTDCVTDLVLAATRHCRSLKKLKMSCKLRPAMWGEVPRYGACMRALQDAVYAGLKVWWVHDGGLRDLALPLERICADAEAHMAHIVAYCPRIRTYRLFTVSRYGDIELLPRESTWKLNLNTWDHFCQVTTDLEKITWKNLPFATHFFETFGNSTKPKLRSLTLMPSQHWSWDDFFRVVDTKTQTIVKATGFGESASRPETIFRATPNLEKLTVGWPHYYSTPPKDFPVFGDDFIEELARCCKNLRKLHHFDAPLTNPITDRSMRALGAMPRLERVHISAANITGGGLFDLLTSHTTARRNYEISLGDRVPTILSTIFYDVLEGFLERLAAHKGTLPCASCRVLLHIDNRSSTDLEPGQSAEWVGKVRHLAQQVRARHPSLQLRGIVRDYKSESGAIGRMSEFRFYTGPDAPPMREYVDTGLRDEPIDDVFVHRIYPVYNSPPLL